jgi:hypothetical protein
MRKEMTAGGLLQKIVRHTPENPFAEFCVTVSTGDDEVYDFRVGERVELGCRGLAQGLAPSRCVDTVAGKPSGDIFDTAVGRLRIMILVDFRDDGFLAEAQQG